ncbi:MAG: hypothetical protein JNJ57_01405 [Saprospiraceae bacterium]|nr:hypothetical protein [Saprospiraceae bacterium]
MKTTTTLLLLLVSTISFSQQKFEVGFIAKAGTYAKPFYNSEINYFQNESSEHLLETRPGFTNVFGFYMLRKLGKRVAVSTELLLRQSSYTNRNRRVYHYTDGFDFFNQQIDRVAETSISIPLKIQVAPFGKGKTAFGIGIALSRLAKAKVKWQYSYIDERYPQFHSIAEYELEDTNFDQFKAEIGFTAGVFHQISKHTSVGLELAMEKHKTEYFASTFDKGFYDCYCYGYALIREPKLRSWTLSLRHNLLQE